MRDILLPLALLPALAAEPLRGQATPLPEDPACTSCRIVFEEVAILGDLDDPASPGPTAEAVRLTDGRVAVTSPTMGPQVLIYETDGRFVRSIGREGEGPGELRTAPFVRAVENAAIALLDPAQGVIHEVDQEGELRGSVRLPARIMAFDRHAAGWIVSGPRPAADGTTTLHLVGAEDGDIASFAPTTETDMRRAVRRVATGANGRVWAAPMNGGGLEQWDAEGRLLAHYLIENADLQRPPPPGGRLDFETVVPPAQVSDLAVDELGRVWIWIVVPDPDFEPGPAEGPRVIEDIYDTRVLVFDPEAGVVAIRDQFDVLLRPLGDGWAFDVIETELGDRKVRIGRISIEGIP